MKAIRFFAIFAVAAIMALVTSCGAVDKGLQTAVEEINKQLESQPKPEGIEKMYMSLDDNYASYNYVVNEDVIDMSLLTPEALKENLAADIFSDGAQERFIKLVKAADRGIKFVYEGNKSGTKVEAVFENSEL